MKNAYLLLLTIAAACGPSTGVGQDGGGDDDAGPCADGQRQCSGQDWQTCQGGNWVSGETCPDACDDTYGCVVCVPNTGTCNGETSTMCRADGSGWVDVFCDPAQGLACNVDTGLCDGVCAPQNLGESYIGCEYYPTVTGNDVLDYFQFAIAVANTSNQPATVTIDEGALTAPVTFQVAPGDVHVEKLPWQTALKLCSNTTPPDGFFNVECGALQQQGALVTRGAFHLRSTQPVTVYQFNPLDYSFGGFFTYTNDASLLLPTNVMTGSYINATYPAWDTAVIGGSQGVFPGLMTITATQDSTQVTVVSKVTTPGGGGAPAFQAGVPQTLTMNRGDVLEIAGFTGDMTGSVVEADKPVQVIGGHYCTFIPPTVGYCDHLEESMFPVETLSTKYLVSAPYLPGLSGPKQQITRIVATQANTTLNFDPPPQGVVNPVTLNNAGDVYEIAQRPEDFLVTANHKILVAHFMEGQDAGGGSGDPAYTLAVATDQYRTSYVFHAPTNYESNFVNITAPDGVTVTLDGTPVTGFTPVGATGFSIARVPLSNGANGNHNATSSEPFGISVYGYGQYTSYWYPGGLDLATIPVP